MSLYDEVQAEFDANDAAVRSQAAKVGCGALALAGAGILFIIFIIVFCAVKAAS